MDDAALAEPSRHRQSRLNPGASSLVSRVLARLAAKSARMTQPPTHYSDASGRRNRARWRLFAPFGREQTASANRRMIEGTGWNMGWRVVTRSLDFISLLVLARLLVPADFGVVALAASLAAAIDAFSQLGVRDALVRLRDERRDYYDTAFTFQMARGLLTAVLLVVLAEFSTAWFGDPRLRSILWVMAGLAVVLGCENIGVVTFTRELNFRALVMMQAATKVLGFVVTVVLAVVLRDFWALICGTAVSRVSGVAITYLVAPHRPRFGFNGWRYLASFSLWAWAGSLAGIVWSRADAFLLGPTLGSALLGIYVVAGQLALMPVTELLEPACAALFPGFALSQRDGTSPVGMALAIAGALALVTLPFSIAVSATSGYLVVGLLGPQWQGSRDIIAILAWVCVFSPFSYVCGSVLSAQGRVKRVFMVNAISALIKVIVVLIVRETHDLQLIALSAVAVVSVEALLFIYQLREVGATGRRQLAITAIRAVLAAAVTTTILLLLPGTWSVVTMERFPALATGTAIGIATFVIFAACQTGLWFFAGRPPGFEQQIVGIVRRVAFRAPSPQVAGD